MALGCKVDNTIDLLILHQLIERLEVADIHLDELVVRLILNILQIGKVTGIGKLVKVDNVVLRIFIDKQTHNVAANKACTACDNDIFHSVISVLIC